MHILLVEDNPHDVFFVQHALKQVPQPIQLSVVQDGEQAINFLFRVAPYAQVAPPDLVLLDIKMPRKTGIDVLVELGQDQDLKRTPVIIFTSSDHPEDINRCYELGANAYIAKPTGLPNLVSAMTSIIDFWGSCKFPNSTTK